MQRRRVPLLPVLVLLGLSALPSSAGGIVCPVSTRAAIPCCAPPTAATDAVPGCCPTACCASADIAIACPVSRLTIVSNPDPSTAGQPVTISGHLSGSGAGTTALLWQKLSGQSGFTRVAQTTTNAAGDYTIVRGAGAMLTNSTWYTTASSATSPMLLQRVRAQIKIEGAWLGGVLILGGSVTPSHRGEHIALQRRTNTGWRTIASAVIRHLSRFTVSHRFAHKGKVVLRVMFAGDARNVQSFSKSVRVSVH
jgi:hypothetical protein